MSQREPSPQAQRSHQEIRDIECVRVREKRKERCLDHDKEAEREDESKNERKKKDKEVEEEKRLVKRKIRREIGRNRN